MERFYPLGVPAVEGAWQTTYEAQNEMRTFERSPYPPGTSIHQPGAREKFGYSAPGPDPWRLSQSHLTLKEEFGNPHPRAHMAVPRLPAPDDREVFEVHDVPEMLRYNSPVARMSMTGRSPTSTVSRARSLPQLARAPPRLSEPPPPVTRIEDEHFTYFVPRSLQREGRSRLNTDTLSKLKKDSMISFPYTGEGLGFKAQNPPCDWFPKGSYSADQPTANREAFQKQSIHRMSPMALSGAFGLR